MTTTHCEDQTDQGGHGWGVDGQGFLLSSMKLSVSIQYAAEDVALCGTAAAAAAGGRCLLTRQEN